MSTPVTPSKRILTEDTHNVLSAPCVPSNNIISDHLTSRLQNLGARVRKSVNEGYATHRFGGIPSTTPTPFSSPVKSTTESTLSQSPAIFRSANDTLLDVFSSPIRCAEVTHSPSLRKRRHAEVEDFQEGQGGCRHEITIGMGNEVSSASEREVPSEDEEVMIITDASSDHRPGRPIRPLKRTVHRPVPPHFSISSYTSDICVSPSDADLCDHEIIPAGQEDNQPFSFLAAS